VTANKDEGATKKQKRFSGAEVVRKPEDGRPSVLGVGAPAGVGPGQAC
jgi:hypothetical protein